MILSIDNQYGQKDESGESITRYLKLEATWILTNISFGDEYVLNEVFNPEHKIF